VRNTLLVLLVLLAAGCATQPQSKKTSASRKRPRTVHEFNAAWYDGSPHERLPLQGALTNAVDYSGLEIDFAKIHIDYAMRPGTRPLEAGDAFHLPRLAWLHVYVQERKPHDYKITCAIPAKEHAPDEKLAAPDERIRFFACALTVLVENNIRPTREAIRKYFGKHPLGPKKDEPLIYYAILQPSGAMVIDETYRK